MLVASGAIDGYVTARWVYDAHAPVMGFDAISVASEFAGLICGLAALYWTFRFWRLNRAHKDRATVSLVMSALVLGGLRLGTLCALNLLAMFG
jgi:hypothetical protein